jgi:calpain-15
MGAEQSACLPTSPDKSQAQAKKAKAVKKAIAAAADHRAKQWQRAIQFKEGSAEFKAYDPKAQAAAAGIKGKKKKSSMRDDAYVVTDAGDFEVKDDGLFMDPEFYPNAESLGGAGGDGVGWMRLSEMFDNEAIFKDDVDPDDICQGFLGDCWLLSSIACLAEFPEVIQSLFVTKEVTEDGKYELRLYDPEAGEWINVIIDDFVPCRIGGDSPLFTSAKGGEMWVSLLEKAIAKMYGSYAKIEGGYSFYAFQMLTGDPVQSAQLGEDGWDLVKWSYDRAADECGGEMVGASSGDDMFDKLLEADRAKWIMAAGTDGVDESTAEGGIDSGGGLVDGHAYSIISVYKSEDGAAKLLRIRNPWGKFEWDGAWCDTDTDNWTPLLEAASEEDKQNFFTETDESALNHGQINAGVQLDDGTFWMHWDDFQTKFGSLDIGENDGKS